MNLTSLPTAAVEQVLDETFPIWGEGLTREAYGRWNRAQMETPWARAHLSRLGWTRAGEVLASAKRYDLSARIGAQSRPVLGIGAVFTSPAHRGQGHARALIEAMLADAAGRGCVAALLFSEIGPEYYERLGFRVIARMDITLAALPMRAGAPAMLVRSGEPGDLTHVAGIAERISASAAFALDRPPDFMAFNLARRRLLAGLGEPGRRSLEFFVAEEGRRAAAYVVLSHGPHGTRLEDCGDLDPTGARVGAMLLVLSSRAPADPPLQVTGWLPAGFRPPQLRVLSERAATTVMMLRPLGESPMIPPGEAAYCYLDTF
jgi:predicted N-acetyltransferase YhbS